MVTSHDGDEYQVNNLAHTNVIEHWAHTLADDEKDCHEMKTRSKAKFDGPASCCKACDCMDATGDAYLHELRLAVSSALNRSKRRISSETRKFETPAFLPFSQYCQKWFSFLRNKLTVLQLQRLQFGRCVRPSTLREPVMSGSVRHVP